MPRQATKPTRADEVRQERRKVRGSTIQSGTRLTVDESKLDRSNYEYRWAKDVGSRMAQLHSDDWDPAPEDAVIGNEGSGSVGTKTGGTDDNGKPYNMVLMRKRKDWFEADQKEKQKPLDAVDEAIRRGSVHERNEPELREGAYTPGQNTVSR